MNQLILGEVLAGFDGNTCSVCSEEHSDELHAKSQEAESGERVQEQFSLLFSPAFKQVMVLVCAWWFEVTGW